jgi:copper chaperone NosL
MIMKTVAVGRFLILIAAAALIIFSMRYPMWYMYLDSNNFPNGIGMSIWATHPGDPEDIAQLDGGLKEVNVLNHFIGMKEISTETLPVFSVLPVVLVITAFACVIAAFIRKKWASLAVVVLFAAISVSGVFVLIYSLYSFGHNLDPTAAIKIDPFMPGIYGEHKLAQFTTYSNFYWGTYLLVMAFILTVAAWGIDITSFRRGHEKLTTPTGD